MLWQPGRLQLEHHGGDLVRLGELPGVGLADVVVLAELAVQVAAAEEDRARSCPAAQRVFLAHVGDHGCSHVPISPVRQMPILPARRSTLHSQAQVVQQERRS